MANFITKKLMNKLVTMFLAVSLLSVVVLGVLTYLSSRSALTKQITTDFDVISTGKEQALLEQLNGHRIECLTHSRSAVITNALEKIDGKSPDSSQVASDLGKYLKEGIDVNPAAYEFFAIDRRGLIVASTDEGHVGMDRSKDAYFTEAQKDVYFKDVFKSDTTRQVGYAVSAPIKNPKTGEFLGVFGMRLDLTGLNQVLADRTGMGKTGENYLVNKEAYAITEMRFVKDATLNQKVETNPVRFFRVNGENTGGVYSDYRNHEVLGFSSGELLKKAYPYLGWVVVSEMDASEAFAPVGTLGIRITIMGIIISALAGVAAFFVARGIADPIRKISEIAVRVAGGDLTETVWGVKSEDEIGALAKATNEMVGSLKNMVFQVLSVAERISSSSQELSSSAQEMNATMEEISCTVQQIAKGTETQALRVDETQKVMDQMAVSVGQISKSAQDAATQASKSSDIAQKGGALTNEARDKIVQIANEVVASANTIKKLGSRGEQIGEIVNVITNIADQTNLLALNAAIEAARAGEYGRGFAVVAEEVRKLAESSAKAAEEISKMIKDVQKETTQAVTTIEGVAKEAASVDEITQRVVKSLADIIKNVEGVAAMIGQVSAASQQQASGTKQVSKSVADIASVAEETASATEEASASTEEMTSSTEEMAASSQELADMGMKLRDMVGKFKIDGKTTEEKKIEIKIEPKKEPPTRLLKLREHAIAMKNKMDSFRRVRPEQPPLKKIPH